MKRIFISMTGIITCMNLMAQTPVSFYPQKNAQDINIDTHLVIVFDKTVKTGSKGIITVTDKTTRKVVDRIDMSIPAGSTGRKSALWISATPWRRSSKRPRGNKVRTVCAMVSSTASTTTPRSGRKTASIMRSIPCRGRRKRRRGTRRFPSSVSGLMER